MEKIVWFCYSSINSMEEIYRADIFVTVHCAGSDNVVGMTVQ